MPKYFVGKFVICLVIGTGTFWLGLLTAGQEEQDLNRVHYKFGHE